MIQDRLTAMFRTAKSVRKPAAPIAAARKVKPAARPAMDNYTQGRKLAGSFWL